MTRQELETRRVSRLYRALKWRIHKRLHKLVIADAGLETFIVRASDLEIGEKLFIRGDYEFDKFRAACDLIRAERERDDPRLLIDIGANCGPVCIPALNRGMFERAVAIEPEPRNAALLRANVALNGLSDRIDVHQVACGDKDGQTLQMELSPTNHGDHRVRMTSDDGRFGEGGRATIAIRSETLDSLCPGAGGDSLIWIDTQGFEGFVLAGASRILSERPAIVAEYWPYAMRRAGSLDAFMNAVAHYQKFIDLELGKTYPISRLPDFWHEDRGTDWLSYTDILIL